MASACLETIRAPLSRARQHVASADANLIGLVTSLAAKNYVSRETIDCAIARCDHARQDMDRAIYAALGVQSSDGRQLCVGDAADMRLAMTTALERIEGRPAPIRTGTPAVGSFVA
ncbi:hypothetical protein [Methylorubrum suomiense]|uniref:ANTAR domain-containing protein n=1 Tax=Methylorubrum suomiense TaxID=144191 RepID=A0ABQ4UYX1_9HYPH|nr:hypothetical protein [Methylorubrum suomiense]GJE77210.1 hypothetical protein BGCPKDLD_3813 [Methylorubrum suomiense]